MTQVLQSSDTFAGLDDNARYILGNDLILLINVQNREGSGSRRRTAATETSIVVHLWCSV